jgi:hypothetical protein
VIKIQHFSQNAWPAQFKSCSANWFQSLIICSWHNLISLAACFVPTSLGDFCTARGVQISTSCVIFCVILSGVFFYYSYCWCFWCPLYIKCAFSFNIEFSAFVLPRKIKTRIFKIAREFLVFYCYQKLGFNFKTIQDQYKKIYSKTKIFNNSPLNTWKNSIIKNQKKIQDKNWNLSKTKTKQELNNGLGTLYVAPHTILYGN